MSAFNFGRSGSADGRDASSFAGRGLSLSAEGSGAPAGLLGLGAVALVAVMSLLLATTATAAPQISGSGIADFWGNQTIANEEPGGRFHGDGPRGIAVNDTTGDVFVADRGNHRVQQFTASGSFVRAWGFDVAQPAASPASSADFEICATASDCKKGVNVGVAPLDGLGGQLSLPAGIAINQQTQHIYVSDVGFSRVQEFRIDDNGTPLNGGDDLPVFVRAFGQDVIQGGKPLDLGSGFEVCVDASECKAGSNVGSPGGVLESLGYLTIAPDGTPNENNVLVVDPNRSRVQEFTASGAFVRSFGWDVVQPGGSGASGINEEQTITLSPVLAAGSTVTFSFGTVAPIRTVPLPIDVEAPELEAALGALGSIGGVGNIDVTGPDGGPFTVEFTGALVDKDQPLITSALAAVAEGTQLTCTGSPVNANRSFQWLTNGIPAAGAGSGTSTYTVAAADAGKALQCRTTATNVLPDPATSAGPTGAVQVSNPALVVAPVGGAFPVAPATITAPAAPVGGFVAGNKLKCTTGTWTGGPTFAFQWHRNGVALVGNGATTNEYTLQAVDLTSAATFQCAVTGSNANGAVTKVSGNRVTASPAPAPSPTAPVAASSISTAAAEVVASQEGSRAFEICIVAAECQLGAPGSGDGQFAEMSPTRIVEDHEGRIYTVEGVPNANAQSGGLRIQRFQLSPGNVLSVQGPFCGTGYAFPTSGGALCGISSLNVSKDHPAAVAVDEENFLYVLKSYVIGSGQPPAMRPEGIANGTTEYPAQYRVLKVDPDTGQVVETFLANPGKLQTAVGGIGWFAHADSFDMDLAVPSAGSPLYFGTPTSSSGAAVARVLRLEQIGGASAAISHEDVQASSARLRAVVTPPPLPSLSTRYRFEYTRSGFQDWTELRMPEPTAPEDPGTNIGNGADGGSSTSCSASPGSRAATCHVSERIDGLLSDQAYEYRLVLTTDFNGLIYVSDPQEFETTPTAPSALTQGAIWSGPPASGPSLVMTGVVNPGAAQSRYYFEFVAEEDFSSSGFDRAQSAPPYPRDIGHGTKDLFVTSVAHGLDSLKRYVVRLVAENPNGVRRGEATVVEPSQAGGRFLELVTEGDYEEIKGLPLTLADSGDRAMVLAFSYPGQAASPYITNPNIAVRDTGGWRSVPVGPDPNDASTGGVGFSGYGDGAVSRRIWPSRPGLGEFQWIARGLDGTLSPLLPALSPIERGANPELFFQGSSPDVSTLAFKLTRAILYPGETLGASALYAINGASTNSPSLDLVNRSSAGAILGGVCGAELGGVMKTRAVSSDGGTVFFSVRPAAPQTGTCFPTLYKPRVFMREAGAVTTPISASECDRPALPAPPGPCSAADGDDQFVGASADGTKAYLLSTRQLADSDTDLTSDLYLYDASGGAGEKLAQVSAGEATDTHPTVGAGAQVLGVTGVSMDGSRTYFVAKGKLVTTASDGANNLYVYNASTDSIRFVAVLSPRPPTGVLTDADTDLWALQPDNDGRAAYVLPYYQGAGPTRVDGDGHQLLFLSEAQLLAVDGDTVDDLYRYDDLQPSGQRLTCLSCGGDGDFRVRLQGRRDNADADRVQQERVASESGSLVGFVTSERLLASDINSAPDGYIWHEPTGDCTAASPDYVPQSGGCLELLTRATGDRGVAAGALLSIGLSPDGGSAFFATTATLLPEDINNGALDWYVARVDGGFPQPEDPDLGDPCKSAGVVCQGEDPQPRPPHTPLSSSQFSGHGNVTEPGGKTCGRAKLRRGNRCVSKRALAKRACAKRQGKAKRRCVNAQMRRLTQIQQRQNRASNENRRAGR